MDEDKKNKEIGLFRYAMIAPVIQENVSVQAEYFREVSKKEYEVPLLSSSAIHRLLIAEGHIGIGEITEATVRKYIRDNMLKEEIPAIARKPFFKLTSTACMRSVGHSTCSFKTI